MKQVVRVIALIVFSIFFRVNLVGRENVPEKGNGVLCSNHVGELDMFFIGFRIKRLVRWMAKEELFKNPVFATLLKCLGAFPIKRGKADVESVKTAIRLLKEGHIVGIFPEGTRIKHKEGKPIRIKPGAVMLALRTGAPIVPVAVSGNYKPFSRIKVIFGEPFFLDADPDRKYTNEEMSKISEDVMKKVYVLLEEKQV